MNDQTKKLILLEEDNGFCRVYYYEVIKNKKRLLCYQSSIGKEFALYECTREGEPSHSIPHKDYVKITPFPVGHTETGEELKAWLVKQRQKSIHSTH